MKRASWSVATFLFEATLTATAHPTKTQMSSCTRAVCHLEEALSLFSKIRYEFWEVGSQKEFKKATITIQTRYRKTMEEDISEVEIVSMKSLRQGVCENVFKLKKYRGAKVRRLSFPCLKFSKFWTSCCLDSSKDCKISNTVNSMQIAKLLVLTCVPIYSLETRSDFSVATMTPKK